MDSLFQLLELSTMLKAFFAKGIKMNKALYPQAERLKID